ncbi:unnamed protein product, partial [Owenia fusiformis]
ITYHSIAFYNIFIMRQQVVFLLITFQNILSTDGGAPKCTCKEDIDKLKETMRTFTSDINNEIATMKSEIAKLVLEMAKLVTNMNMGLIIGKLNTLTNEINENGERLDTLTNENNEKMATLKTELTSTINQNKVKLDALKTQMTETNSCACESRKQRRRIYYAGGYIYTFAQAKAYCEGQGHTIATPGQMDAAFELGMAICGYGWLSDGSIRYPTQMPSHTGGCGKRGVNTIFN